MTSFFSKTRKKLFLLIPTVAFVLLSLLGLSACGNKSLTEDSIIEMGYTVAVVFDYNGGAVNGNTNAKIRIKENSKVPDPGSSLNQLSNPTRNNYSFRCFVTAKTDENGNPLYEDDGNVVVDKVWDFEKDIPTGSMTLYAWWWNNYRVEFHYGDDFSNTKVASVSRNQDGSPKSLTSSNYAIDGYTVLDYYYDNACSEENRIPSIPIRDLTSSMFENSDDKLTLDIWCKALEGTYTVVRQASDFNLINADTNIYLYSNIVLPEDRSFTFPNTYRGKFIGAGHSITNLNVSTTSSNSSDYYYGMFKSIESGAEIRDVTFINASLSVNLYAALQQANISLFAGRIREGATVSNVTISGSIDYEVVPGFTAFDHIDIEGFASRIEGSVTDCELIGDLEIVKSTVVYTDVNSDSDTDYALYFKCTESEGKIVLGDLYGLASKSRQDSTYNEFRFRSIVKNTFGLTYTITTSRGNYCAVIKENNDGSYAAEVTSSGVVYTEDRSVGVYIRSKINNGNTELVGVYGIEAVGEDGRLSECEVTSIVDNNDGTFTINTDNAVYSVKVELVNNTFSVTVSKA